MYFRQALLGTPCYSAKALRRRWPKSRKQIKKYRPFYCPNNWNRPKPVPSHIVKNTNDNFPGIELETS
jgi:hypothetical protein